VLLGHNFRMTDIQAAVGREQLKRLPDLVRERRELAERYHTLLKEVPEITIPTQPDYARSNWQSYCVRLPDRVEQKNVMQYMLDHGISTRRGVMCAHREPAYSKETWSCGPDHDPCDCEPFTCRHLRESEAAQDHGLVIPLFNGLTEEDQQRVVDTLKATLAK
jgi:dTDP-4-amino-4,6-dideoxygalactose transaminase